MDEKIDFEELKKEWDNLCELTGMSHRINDIHLSKLLEKGKDIAIKEIKVLMDQCDEQILKLRETKRSLGAIWRSMEESP